jgi:hypothetical protein
MATLTRMRRRRSVRARVERAARGEHVEGGAIERCDRARACARGRRARRGVTTRRRRRRQLRLRVRAFDARGRGKK